MGIPSFCTKCCGNYKVSNCYNFDFKNELCVKSAQRSVFYHDFNFVCHSVIWQIAASKKHACVNYWFQFWSCCIIMALKDKDGPCISPPIAFTQVQINLYLISHLALRRQILLPWEPSGSTATVFGSPIFISMPTRWATSSVDVER